MKFIEESTDSSINMQVASLCAHASCMSDKNEVMNARIEK